MNWWRFGIYLSWKHHWHWRIVEIENRIRERLGKRLKTSCANCGEYYVQDLGEHPNYEIDPDPWLLCLVCREN
jgi:formylmethanofuran dehydrogenase subunit E